MDGVVVGLRIVLGYLLATFCRPKVESFYDQHQMKASVHDLHLWNTNSRISINSQYSNSNPKSNKYSPFMVDISPSKVEL